MSEEIKPPPDGATSVRFGPAFLRPAKDPGHFELMRPIITVRNEGDRVETEQHADAIPIAVYRIKGRGDMIPPRTVGGPEPTIRSFDSQSMKPIELILVWWPRMGME